MTSRRSVVSSSELPPHEAERLLAVASGQSLAELRLTSVITDEHLTAFRRLEVERLAGEPLQYLEGSVPFGSAEIHVDARVLIPRPETEEILADTIAAGGSPRVIVDLCTGSGNLAVGLASAFPDAEVFATDISADACDVATTNAQAAGVEVHVLQGDLFAPLPRRLRNSVDLLVANPPYLSAAEYDDVAPDVRREPRMALVSGPSGLEVLAAIAAEASDWLAPGGRIVCEIGSTQGRAASELFMAYRPVIRKDMYGLDRSVVGTAAIG